MVKSFLTPDTMEYTRYKTEKDSLVSKKIEEIVFGIFSNKKEGD